MSRLATVGGTKKSLRERLQCRLAVLLEPVAHWEATNMSLFEKRNPKANARSVLVNAFICAFVGAIVFVLFAKPAYKDAWPVTLPIWLAGCAGIGALWEWQVARAD